MDTNKNTTPPFSIDEDKELNVDLIENKFTKIYPYIFFAFVIVAAVTSVSLSHESKSLFNFFCIIIVFTHMRFLQSILILNKLICPYCHKKYFSSTFSISDGLKQKIIKANTCISCNRKAKIISHYNNPEGVYNNMPWTDWGKNKKK